MYSAEVNPSVSSEVGINIRRAQPSDRDRLYDICLKTGDLGRDASAKYPHDEMLGDVYAGAYLEFDPDFCFLLSVDGEVLGYAIAALDTKSFASKMDEIWAPRFRVKYYDELGTLNENEQELWETINKPFDVPLAFIDKYPSHLHIDLVEAVQGRGLGKVLIEHLFVALQSARSPGVHLGVARHNVNAIKFYERLGFELLNEYPETLFYGRKFT